MVLSKFKNVSLLCSSLMLLIIAAFQSCTLVKNSAKQELSDGYYTKITTTGNSKVYIDVTEETIAIYPTQKHASFRTIDTTLPTLTYSSISDVMGTYDFVLSKNSLDVDFITMPLKYRWAQQAMPPQLNANLNGAFYLGFRNDRYKINYIANPIRKAERYINHFGYSVGVFTGIGNTAMNAATTGNSMLQDYDGIVWSKGIAAIVGVNFFTIGLALGFDNLMDHNRTIWLYESKPWVGVAVGLNLN